MTVCLTMGSQWRERCLIATKLLVVGIIFLTLTFERAIQIVSGSAACVFIDGRYVSVQLPWPAQMVALWRPRSLKIAVSLYVLASPTSNCPMRYAPSPLTSLADAE